MASALQQTDARRATQVTRGKARSFYLASLFLPTSVRPDVHALYAFYRMVDDLIDEPPVGFNHQDILSTLVEWEGALRGTRPPENPFVAGVINLAELHAIPVEYLCMVLEGARFDLDLRVMQTRKELIRYSVLMAGSVGMVMSYLLGTSDAQSLAAASDLGVAMQITNVLRDVGEDLCRGRIYLPQEELEAHGYSLRALQGGAVDEPFRNVMRSLVDEARLYYESGRRGIDRLDRSVQFSIYLATTLYGRILDKIEEHEFNVFTRRASLNTTEKWMLTMPTYRAYRRLSRRNS